MKKKIIVFIILSTIILIGIIYLLSKKQENVIESNFEIKETITAENSNNANEDIETTNENPIEDIPVEEMSTNNKVVSSSEDERLIDKNSIIIKTEEKPKQEEIKKQETTVNNNIIPVEETKKEQSIDKITIAEEPMQDEQPKEQETVVQKQPTKDLEQEAPVQTPKEENKKEESKVEEQEETKVEQEKKNIEEYKINQEMINRIKTIIENNETEDMKTYGYEIVVDSTIPELTNEFTFTEKRVINKITWSCGVIRIYARDYYFNGNYVSTQCFIL